MMRSRAGAVLSLWALLSLLVVPVFPHFVSPNETTRWALAAAAVEEGTLEITRPAAILGGGVEDVAEVGGRLYSNKAPGGALVALPGYLAARAAWGPASPGTLRPQLTAMRLVGSTLPVVLLALLFLRRAPEEGRAPALAALLLGTPLLAYGLLLFSHALAAAALFGAWAALFPADGGVPRFRRDVAAGALLALATVAEYPVAVPAAVLALTALWGRWRRLVPLAAGALPFALLLGAYDAACFGSPFALSSGHERDAAFRSLSAHGLFGVGLPQPGYLARLLVDPSKGLLVFSPVLLLVPAALLAARGRVAPRALAALVAAPLALLAVYAGYPNWHGGFTVGARYLVPALPFLAFPLAFLRWGRLSALLLGFSVAAVAVTTLVFPFVPPGFPLPWASFALPLLSQGLVVPSLLHLVARPLALAVPFLLVAAAALVALPARGRLPFAGGVALALAVGLAWLRLFPLSPPLLVQRGYVTDVYFDRPGALERSLPAGMAPPPQLLLRRERERTLPPPPWPF